MSNLKNNLINSITVDKKSLYHAMEELRISPQTLLNFCSSDEQFNAELNAAITGTEKIIWGQLTALAYAKLLNILVNGEQLTARKTRVTTDSEGEVINTVSEFTIATAPLLPYLRLILSLNPRAIDELPSLSSGKASEEDLAETIKKILC
jgi:hypothetical protein